MNKKQLTIARSKKFLAFILDLIIMVIIASIIVSILGIIIYSLFKIFGLYAGELSDETKSAIEIMDFIFKALIVLLYFWWIPKKIGNTFGRKLLKIKDKFNIFWTWPFLREKDSPQKHLRKIGTLKVISKDGYWICPSCNEKNKEIQDVCSNCGQEIEQ